MSEHYDFHYQPTGSGAISGQQVLQQTEDAINELGDYVNDNVGGAMDVAQQALETAQNAEQDAQTALDTANSFSSAIQSAQQDASTALSTAQTAQTTASNANNTAIQAQQDASSAVTTANNASGQVSTLSGTVTALGQRVTTAEGNIGQNTSDITALTTRVGTAEGNITTLQNDVSIAQGNASSAMATAGTVKQQAYVLRYSSTSVTDNSTISYSTLDNTDNIKTGDKVIDVDGKIFTVVSVDTANETVTVGTSLIDLAKDSDVVHKSGDETSTGFKQFANIRANNSIKGINLDSTTTDLNNCYSDYAPYAENKGGNIQYYYCNTDSGTANISKLPEAKAFFLTSITTRLISNSLYVKQILINSNSKTFTRYCANNTWSSWVNETDSEYVHKSGNETVGGAKTFSEDIVINNSDTSQTSKRLVIRSSKVGLGDSNSDTWGIYFNAGESYASLINSEKSTSSIQGLNFTVRTKDANDDLISASYRIRVYTDGNAYLSPVTTNYISLGSTNNKWKDTCTSLINGLTPSSLSMPVAPSSTSYVDISGYITVLDSSSANTYTPPSNGYITFSVTGNLVQIFHDYGLQGKWTVLAGNANRGFIPVLGGVEVKIYVIASNVDKFWFIPCQGNV